MSTPSADDIVSQHQLAKAHRVNALMMPDFWKNYSSPNSLIWVRKPFGVPADQVPDDKVGVYCFVIEPGISNLPMAGLLAYIGRAKNSFRQRYRDYLRDKDDPSARIKVVTLLRQWADHLGYYYAELPTADEAAAEELRLIEAFIPEFNTQLPAKVQARIGAF